MGLFQIRGVAPKNNLLLICVILLYLLISPLTGFPFDEAVLFQRYYWIYFYGIQPFYYWLFGVYYLVTLLGGLLINIPFSLFNSDNVLVQEFSIKFPLILAAFISGLTIEALVKHFSHHKVNGVSPTLLFLLIPITVYDVAFHGNPLIIAVMFLLLSTLFLFRGKFALSSVFLGMASATYLYPLFFALPFIKSVRKVANTKSATCYSLVFIATFVFGQIIPILVYIFTKTPLVYGSILAGESGTSSLTSTSAAVSPWGPYIFLSSLTGFELTTSESAIIFVILMSLSMIIFLIKKQSNENQTGLISYLFLSNFIFVVFATNTVPQYLLALVPFALILGYLGHDFRYIIGLTLASVLDICVMLTSSSNNLFVFFLDANPLVSAYSVKWPSNLYILMGMLYIFSLSLLLFWHLDSMRIINHSIKKRHLMKEREVTEAFIGFLKEEEHYIQKGVISLSLVAFIVFFMVSPSFHSVPAQMSTIPSLSQYTSEANLENKSINKSCYVVSPPYPWQLTSTQYRLSARYNLTIPLVDISQAVLGDFSQQSILEVHNGTEWSINFTFPYCGNFQGYFLIFGDASVPPFVCLVGNSAQNIHFSMNLSSEISIYSITSHNHVFYTFYSPVPIPEGSYSIIFRYANDLSVPTYLSISQFNSSGATFFLLNNGTNVHVPASSISELVVNGTLLKNITIAFYLYYTESVSISFNGHFIGFGSAIHSTNFQINPSYVYDTNFIHINGSIKPIQSPILSLILPINFSPQNSEYNLYGIIIGLASFVVILAFALFILRWVTKNLHQK